MYAWELNFYTRLHFYTLYMWHLVKLQTDICIRLKCHFYEYYVVMMMSIQFILHTILLIINSYFALFICSVKCICCCSFTERNGFGFKTSNYKKNQRTQLFYTRKTNVLFSAVRANGRSKEFYYRSYLTALLQYFWFVNP